MSMNDRIQRHGKELLAIFPDALEQDPLKLYKRLRLTEGQAHRLAERQCSDPNLSELESDRLESALHVQANKLLGTDRVWLNGDPRGYALKIDLEPGEKLFTDWGGYGIITPNLS